VSFAAITLCVASQRVFVVVAAYFFIHSVRKLLDTRSYVHRTLPEMNFEEKTNGCLPRFSSLL
jgi:hypothetical protein